MALPKDPTTKTSAAAPPPQEPPVVDTAKIFTPKPPPDLPSNVRVSSPAQAIANLRIPDVSDEALIAAFKDKPIYVLDRVNWSKLKSPDRKRLENLINQDPALKKILDYVLPVYPPENPQVQPQPQPAPAPEIPTATAEQITKQEPTVALKTKEITPENAPAIQAWLNGLKDHVYSSFAQSAGRDVGTSQLFTRNLLSSLALYRGGLAGFYLSEGSKELIFSALGPIGDAFRTLYEKDVQRKMSWMKNPLNPDAIYYYLNSLPNQMAFKLMYLPAKATFGILARGGAPLISKVYYQRYGQTRQSYVFTPLLRATQFSNKLADGADKLSGIVTDDTNKYWGEKSPYDRYVESKNSAFSKSLKELKNAKLSKNKDSIEKAQHNLRLLLNEHDGFYRYFTDKKGDRQSIYLYHYTTDRNGKRRKVYNLSPLQRAAFSAAGVSRAIFKNGLKNFSRRARRAAKDPITGIFALIAGTLVDILAGIGINILRVAATRIINLIPGTTVLRARLTEFFTSNRYLTTARIGGATIQSFGKGVFSMTTASTTYAGASVGGWIANALGLPAYPFQVIGGGVGATFGSIYTTSLKMANTQIPGWVQEYQTFKGASLSGPGIGEVWGQQALNKGYMTEGSGLLGKIKQVAFGPGPLTRFANWLHNNPFARLPINGFMVADLGVRFLGWNPWVAYPSLIAGDYLWQVKGKLGQIIWEKWLGPPIKDFAAKIYGKYIFPRWAQFAKFGLPGEAGLTFIDKPWLRGLKNIWSKAQPYLRNFFNPGFLMGFSLTPLLTPALGGWAYLAGPVLGSTGWLAATRIAASVIGYSGAGVGAFMARFNALGWTGFIIGQATGWIFFGWNVPFWYTAAWSVGLPLIGTVIQTLAWTAGFSTISAFLGTALSTITGGFISALGATSAIASGLAIWATVTSIALVAGLTIFAGFVIYSAFWVPLQEMMHAGPQSACFNLQTSANIASDSAEICSKFTVTTDLLTNKGYIRNEIGGVYNLLLSDYVHLENNITKATRQIPNQALENLNYVASPEFINPGNPLVATNRYTFPLSENILQLADSRGIMLSYLVSWLSTFTGNPNSNKMTIFDLIAKYPQFPGLQQMVNSSFDLLKQVQADETAGRNDTIYKFEKTRDFTKDQKDTYGAIRDKLVAAKNSTTLETIKNNLINPKPRPRLPLKPIPLAIKSASYKIIANIKPPPAKNSFSSINLGRIFSIIS